MIKVARVGLSAPGFIDIDAGQTPGSGWQVSGVRNAYELLRDLIMREHDKKY